jgi:hypothetical protein
LDYERIHKGESFKGTEVSRKRVAVFITDLIEHPEKKVNTSIGIDKSNTEGSKLAFY